MACCDCCCAEGKECCKAPGPAGVCCAPEYCCGTSEAPICCDDATEFCCDEACCLKEETCCEGVCCPEDECCVDGVCGPCDEVGVCCLPDGTCSTEYATQEECETCKIDCSQIYEGADPPPECVEDPDSCFDGGGFWERYTTDLSSCDECTGADVNSCSPIPPGPANPCGTWLPGKACADAPCPCETEEDCGALGDCRRCVDGECVACPEGEICCDGSCASEATAQTLCEIFGPTICDECPDDPP
jgi:hypothetical protein